MKEQLVNGIKVTNIKIPEFKEAFRKILVEKVEYTPDRVNSFTQGMDPAEELASWVTGAVGFSKIKGKAEDIALNILTEVFLKAGPELTRQDPKALSAWFSAFGIVSMYSNIILPCIHLLEDK